MSYECAHSLLVFLIILASGYCLIVSVCVAGRMSKETAHAVRLPIVAIGGLSAWAIIRTAAGGWGFDPVALGHAVIISIAALALAFSPRIPT
jgi:hypothetical protein